MSGVLRSVSSPLRVSIYMGHHKVGSTSLQVFLSQNAVRLTQAGLLYPFTEMQGAAQALARMMQGTDRAEVLPVNMREPHSALAYRLMADTAGFTVPREFQKLPHSQQMLHAIAAQVAALKPKGVILCSEAFANFGAVNPDLINRLCDTFPKARFNLYCALRRPDEYLISWHCQRIKVGTPCGQLSHGAWAGYKKTIHFDYRLAVEAWLERVPGQKPGQNAGPNKILRNYRDVLGAGGSEADYMAHSGLDFPAGLLPAVAANKSLPLATTEICRQGNAALPRPEARQLSQFLLQLDQVVPLPANAEVEMFGPTIREKMHRAFQPIHAWLSQTTGQASFFPDIDRMLEPRPLPEPQAMRIVLDALTPERTAALPEAARSFLAGLRSSFRP